MSAWKKAGFTFNKYIAVSSQTLRSVLKNDLKVAAEKRNESDVNVFRLVDGKLGQAEKLTLTK